MLGVYHALLHVTMYIGCFRLINLYWACVCSFHTSLSSEIKVHPCQSKIISMEILLLTYSTFQLEIN